MELSKTPCTSDSPLDLSQLPRHAEAVVAEILAPARLAARLRELGFLPGEHLRVLRSGTAIIVQIGQTRLALRRRDAAAIRLVPFGRAQAFGELGSAELTVEASRAVEA